MSILADEAWWFTLYATHQRQQFTSEIMERSIIFWKMGKHIEERYAKSLVYGDQRKAKERENLQSDGVWRAKASPRAQIWHGRVNPRGTDD